MAKRKVAKRKVSRGTKVGIGAAVAGAAAAAAAGAYYFYGSKNAAKHRKQAKGWMNSAKKDVQSAIKKVNKEITKADYEKLVNQAMKKYHKLSSTSTAEVNSLARELKKEWTKIKKRAATPKKRTTKKTAKRKTTKRKTAKKRSTRRR